MKTQDDRLLQDLEAGHYKEETIDALKQQGITTYSRLFALLLDEATDVSLRIELCQVLSSLYKIVDKRRVATPLMVALASTNADLSTSAARALGQITVKRAIPQLGQLATDKSLPDDARLWTILALGWMHDQRATPFLWQIVYDKTDISSLRGDALEQISSSSNQNDVQKYIDLLQDEAPDVRFWAAYCLTQGGLDVSAALNVLDKVVAFDHNLPIGWAWHVDREALLPFENIHFRRLQPPVTDDEKDYFYSYSNTYLVSPASEYASFIHDYRHWTESWVYTTDPTPPITLNIDPAWFADQLRARWPDVALNVREPRPQAYSVDFQVTIDGQALIGSLHRDGYALVLTSRKDAPVFAFTAWYRSLFAPDQPLYLYEWSHTAIPINAGMSASNVETTYNLLNANYGPPMTVSESDDITASLTLPADPPAPANVP